MIPHFTRVLTLWRIAGHYRLDVVIRRAIGGRPMPLMLSFALLMIRLNPSAWFSKEYKDPMALRYALEQMGPLFVKMGQLLSTRRDLVDAELLEPLQYLQDRVQPFDVKLVRAEVETAFQQSIESLFSRFDDVPLAAASMAQVHTASFHDGREVVVKVIRPNLKHQLLEDFDILAWIGTQLESRLESARALHLQQVIQDYRQVILAELDLTLEASNTRKFRHNFMGSRMMYVPEVYMDAPNVMVEERITGVPISDLDTFDRLGIDRAQLAEKGLTIFFTQVFRDNFFHADMHPGNVFVETINPADPRFIALDCAIAGQLSDTDRLTIARLLLAVIQNNFTQLIQIIHQAGWIPPNTDQHALAREMKRTVGPMISKPMDQLDFAGILVDVMDVARRYRLDIPPQLVLLLKTLVHVEGLGRDLYPQLDIWKLAKPILTGWLKDHVNPVKTLKEFGRQLPDLLMGATDLPTLVTDSLHGLRQQSMWQDKQYRELQEFRRDTEKQQSSNVLMLGGMVIVLAVASHAPWYVVIILMGMLFWRLTL